VPRQLPQARGTPVGDTWYRMSEWTATPGGSVLCARCIQAERKTDEAPAATVTASGTTAATARRITAAAKAAAPGTRFVTASQGPYSFRVTLPNREGVDEMLAVRAAATALRGLDGMTTTWGRARNGKIVVDVTDETAREAAIQEQADARDAAMARELGYSSVEAYRGAPGRAEVNLSEATYGCVQHIERGPECGPDCEELTASYALTPATVTLTNAELWA